MIWEVVSLCRNEQVAGVCHRSLFARILAAFPCIIWRLTLAQQNCLLFANHWAQWLRWRRTARKPDNSLVQPAESAWIFFFYITLCSFLVNWKTIGLSVCPLTTTHNHLITRWLHWSFNRRQSSVFSHSLPVRNILVIKYLLSNLWMQTDCQHVAISLNKSLLIRRLDSNGFQLVVFWSYSYRAERLLSTNLTVKSEFLLTSTRTQIHIWYFQTAYHC